jgi:hypothetical protein
MMLGSLTVSPAEQDLRLGPPRVEPGADANSPRRVTFRYRPPADTTRDGQPIEAAYLTGTFNEWNPTGRKLDGPDAEGFYTTDLELPTGRHEYKFTLNGTEYHADPGNREIVGFYGNSVIEVK